MKEAIKRQGINLIYIISFLLGMVLWIGLSTDFSWNSDITNLFYAPFVGVFGLIALFFAKKYDAENQKKQYYYLLPSIFGGVPYIASGILTACFLVSFTTLGVSEEKDGKMIQQELSPNKSFVAEAYFYDNGTAEGNGNLVKIHLKYKNIPFVRRDISSTSISEYYEYSSEYFHWDDNNNIIIQEPFKIIDTNTVRFKWPIIPLVFLTPYGIYLLIKLGYKLFKQGIKNASTS